MNIQKLNTITPMETVDKSQTQAVAERAAKEAKRLANVAKREAKKAINTEVNSSMSEAMRGLNASASYMSSAEGVANIAKQISGFSGKVSKGSLLTAFKAIDAAKQERASANGKTANLILTLKNGERRAAYSNAHLKAAAKFLTT